MAAPLLSDQHVYHHNDPVQPKVRLSVEKNTKGYNWSVEISYASSVDEAIRLMVEAEGELQKRFGAKVEGPVLPV